MNDLNTKNFFEILSEVSEAPKKIISSFVNFVMSGNKSRIRSDIEEIANEVISLREYMMSLTDSQLKAKKEEFQTKIRQGVSLDSILVEAFAVAREAARRVLGEEHYKVQIMGGIALHMNMIAEMKTGEGKTLVAVLPAYLNALLGRGVHIITVNDYLAQRDSKWMGRVFNFLGLTVGCITSDRGGSTAQKRKQYAADITYCTNSELGFDFLRDNMAMSADECVQRGLYYCIIDEADSVMIDDARTPLIISGATDSTSETYSVCDKVVKHLEPGDYEIDKKEMHAYFTDSGIASCIRQLREMDELGPTEELYSPKNSVILHQLSQALRANHLYDLGVEYIVEEDTDGYAGVKIVDENTGRTLHGRRYSDGLHQALEAKEGVYIRPESETVASVTYQRLFKLFEKKSGMTGTAQAEEEEFESTYGIKCIAIETNKPKQRMDFDDLMYITKEAKIRGIIELVRECNEKGQPVIIGTSSVESSEEFAHYLTKAGFKLNLLNAKNHEKEAEIIANAGRHGAITVVTNMAGRGTDIRLGGDWKVIASKLTDGIEDEEEIKRIIEEVQKEVKENQKKVIEVGGLYIIGTERSEVGKRPEDQLRGRSGRQGDPGASRFFVSAEDNIIKKFNPNMITTLKRFGADEDDIIDHPLVTGAISNAQKRISLYHYQMRQSLQKYSDIKEANMVKFYKTRRSILTKKDITSYITDEFERFLSERKKKEWFFAEKTDAELKLDFYGKMSNLKAEKGDRANEIIRAIALENFDASWRRYLLLMNNAKDIVDFQSYTDKDPLISYYNIAQNKFAEVMSDAIFGCIKDIIELPDSDSSFEKPSFGEFRDYFLKALKIGEQELEESEQLTQKSDHDEEFETDLSKEDQMMEAENADQDKPTLNDESKFSETDLQDKEKRPDDEV